MLIWEGLQARLLEMPKSYSSFQQGKDNAAGVPLAGGRLVIADIYNPDLRA